MKTKGIITISFMIAFLFIGVFDAEAQKKKRRPAKEEVKENSSDPEVIRVPGSFKDKMTYDILGNFGFGNGLSLGLKTQAGYKITNNLSAGIAAKFAYFFQNNIGFEDVSFIDYGAGPYARVSFLGQYYIQAEYDYNNIQLDRDFRKSIWGPYIGGGYLSGYGDWTFGLQVMFILENEIRDRTGQVVDFYFGATYNF